MSNMLRISRPRFLLLLLTIFFIAGGQLTLSVGQVHAKPGRNLIAMRLGPVQQGVATDVAFVGGPFSLYTTNGNKIVTGPNGTLHSVFEDVGVIKYTSSTDGFTWSMPVSISPSGATQPTIAVTSNFIGVAYAMENESGLFYRFKPLIGSWQPAVAVSFIGGEEEPSMVSYGSNMHLAWANSSSINYVSFPANTTSTPASVENYINVWTLCGTWRAERPSIAVSQTSATDMAPLVRVSYFSLKLSCPSQNDGFGFIVSQRPSGPPTGLNWPIVFGGMDFSYANLSNTGRISNSMCANPTTGDFYIGVSWLSNGIGTTHLMYENAWNATDPWRTVQILPRQSLIHVATGRTNLSCSSLLRIAVTDFTQGADGYGPTWIRTGEWVGPTANGPIWGSGGLSQISSSGREAQAIFWEKQLGSKFQSFMRYVYAIYDEKSGSSYTLKLRSTTVNGLPMFLDCNPFPAT